MVLTEYVLPSAVNVRLALVTDVHEGNPDPIIDLLKRARPDIICIAGDTFERYGEGEDPRMRESLTPLQKFLHNIALRLNDVLYLLMGGRRERNPENIFRFLREVGRIPKANGENARVFLSLGNHEWWLEPDDLDALQNAGIILLDNAYAEMDGYLVGGVSPKPDAKMLAEFCGREGYKILLCHHPEYYEKFLKGKNIDLILSGHAHGGQIRLLGRGIFSPGQGFFPKYHHGVYDGHLVVSAGCANTASIPRWGNPCEVVSIELKKM